jgi:short subunit dehydrogenase-like uncharacterized protein
MAHPDSDSERPFDVVLWGASGFTGRLVAEHLVQRAAGGSLRLALAGRNRARLEEVRQELAEVRPEASGLPILLGDSFDRPSLDALAAQASVVCSTVGPYARYGHDLVAACADHHTHYCDLTGEVPFIRASIDAHHDRARADGTRIVHCCGFDSIPSDLGTWMLQEAALDRCGEPLDRVTLYAGPSRGSFSGGTVASMLDVLADARRDRGTRRLLADPYALNPEGQRHGPDGRDPSGVRFDADIGAWTGPFVMASINTRIVRRTDALLGSRYGRGFRYAEVARFGAGLKGRIAAMVVSGLLGAFVAAASRRATRALLQATVLPDPGEGPDREARESGFFTMRLIGKRGGATVLEGRVTGSMDPGYGQTAVMLGESALCLAHDHLASPGGVLTPAAAMGPHLLERLRGQGMVFEVLDPRERA